MERVLAERAARWNDLTRRVLSALVLLPMALFCIWAGGWWFLASVLVAVVGLAAEWVALCGWSAASWPGIALPVALVAAATISASGMPALGVAILLFGGVMVLTLAPAWAQSAAVVAADPMPGLGWLSPPRRALAAGFPYLGLAAVALPWLRGGATGWPDTLFILSVVWASDIGAYAIGRLAGGPKMAPAISPGKTWSGAAGGLAAAILAGGAVAACFSPGISPSHVLVLTICLGLVSQAGDLLESALKRHFGVKDSGRIIPGHGGLLDRLDAVLAVAPVAAAVACTVGRGVVLWR